MCHSCRYSLTQRHYPPQNYTIGKAYLLNHLEKMIRRILGSGRSKPDAMLDYTLAMQARPVAAPRQPARVVIPDNPMGWHTRAFKAHPLKVVRSRVIEKPGRAERHVYQPGRAQPHEEVPANIRVRMGKAKTPYPARMPP